MASFAPRRAWVPDLVLTIYVIIIALPILNMIVMSFKTYGEILRFPISWPAVWHFENYIDAWTKGNLGQLLLNTAIVSVCSTLIVLVSASMAAYVIARYPFSGSQAIYLTFMAGMALPIQMLAIPMFVVMRQLSLIDSPLSLILAYAATGLAFSIFLLVNFIRTIPREIDEAALIDGAGPATVFVLIILPLLRPALTTVAVFQIVAAWNGFFFPLVFIQDPEKMTVTVGVLSFVGQYGTQWDLLLPALVIVMLPTLLVFAVASKQFTRNLAAGSVKL